MAGLRRALVAVAAGLALADASIVALALPPILVEMDTTITGVAAVVGVYALVLALAILPARAASGSARGASLAVRGRPRWAAASPARSRCCCSSARCRPSAAPPRCSPPSRCWTRASRAPGRRLWLGAALSAPPPGPAIGGALTEALRLARDLLRPGPARRWPRRSRACAASAATGDGRTPPAQAGDRARGRSNGSRAAGLWSQRRVAVPSPRRLRRRAGADTARRRGRRLRERPSSPPRRARRPVARLRSPRSRSPPPRSPRCCSCS